MVQQPYVPFASFEAPENHSYRTYVDPDPPPVPPSTLYIRLRPIIPYGWSGAISGISFWNADFSVNLYVPSTETTLNWTDVANAFDDNSGTYTLFQDETALLDQWIAAQITAPLVSEALTYLGIGNSEYVIPPQAGFVDTSPDGIVWTPDGFWFEAAGVASPSSSQQTFTLEELATDQGSARVWGIQILESNDTDEVWVGKLEFLTGYGQPDLCVDGYGWANRCPPSSNYPGDAFSLSTSEFWRPALTGVATGLLIYVFASAPNPSCVAITAANFGGGARAPKSFRVVYTLNGLDWIQAHEINDQTGWADNERREWCWIE
jgi:hypothetical protein